MLSIDHDDERARDDEGDERHQTVKDKRVEAMLGVEIEKTRSKGEHDDGEQEKHEVHRFVLMM